jgi:hypothetical protein
MREALKLICCIVLAGIIVWLICTSTAYRFFNPSKTETQIFLHIPQSFILDFKE